MHIILLFPTNLAVPRARLRAIQSPSYRRLCTPELKQLLQAIIPEPELAICQTKSAKFACILVDRPMNLLTVAAAIQDPFARAPTFAGATKPSITIGTVAITVAHFIGRNRMLLRYGRWPREAMLVDPYMRSHYR